jgi:hypothetical protein
MDMPRHLPELWKGSPFPGLRAFMPDDAPIFFGRGRETDELVARLGDPFTCVVGAPGVGKSSLVGAGLLPRLTNDGVEGGANWPWIRFTPGDNPFLSLADALIRKLPIFKDRLPHDLAAALAEQPAAVSSLIAAALLLFIDQFEELFTLTAARYRAPFVALLESAAATGRLRVVAALRADFYHRCLEYPALVALLRRGSYPLAAPGADALLELITRPAALAGLEFETGLVERILDDAGDLTSLAYLLNMLYHAASHPERTGTTALTHAAYAALSGAQGAIPTQAQAALNKLDKAALSALPGLFQNLVRVDEHGTAIRRQVALNTITGDGLRLVSALIEARLLAQSVGDNPVVEVAHESLLHSWPLLAAWTAEAQEDLILLRQVRRAAAQWKRSGQDKALLWPHERLLPVYAMEDRLKPALDETTQDFIKLEFEWLLDELDDPQTTHGRRVTIGNRLAGLGDIRPGVGLRSDGLPEIAWCIVPGGTVSLEHIPGVFEVKPLRIALYPVTYIQYRAFLEATDGYNDERWWDGLQHFYDPGVQTRPTVNLPAERVSWYDAVAFCRWLTAKYRALASNEQKQPPQSEREGSVVIRLPTEWEWQQAATYGNPANTYPWGVTWDSSRANASGSGLRGTTSVGMYPQGAAGCGALDMSGNVWEWCLNEYENPANVGIGGAATRALRGGSWRSTPDRARTASRNRSYPVNRTSNVGFRVVAGVPVATL